VVISQESALTRAQSNGAASFASLNEKVNSIDIVLAPYTDTCSTDLTGPDGPAQYFFACSSAKP
jgi:hypothetical protein